MSIMLPVLIAAKRKTRMTKRRINEAEVNRREARKRSGATAGHLHHLVHVLEVHEGQDHIVVADEGEGQGND